MFNQSVLTIIALSLIGAGGTAFHVARDEFLCRMVADLFNLQRDHDTPETTTIRIRNELTGFALACVGLAGLCLIRAFRL